MTQHNKAKTQRNATQHNPTQHNTIQHNPNTTQHNTTRYTETYIQKWAQLRRSSLQDHHFEAAHHTTWADFFAWHITTARGWMESHCAYLTQSYSCGTINVKKPNHFLVRKLPKYLLFAECEVRTASYGPIFSPSFYGPSAKRAGHENREGKN